MRQRQSAKKKMECFSSLLERAGGSGIRYGKESWRLGEWRLPSCLAVLKIND